MKQFLLSLVSANSSNSSTRFVALTVVINVMVVWTLVCIKNMNIVDIPWGVLGLVGLVLTGKVIQKKIENGSNGESESWQVKK